MTIPRNDTPAAEPSTKKTVGFTCFHKLFGTNKNSMEVRDMENAKYGGSAFVCPHCSSYAQQDWQFIITMSRDIPDGYGSIDYVDYYEIIDSGGPQVKAKIAFSDCKVCSESAVWFREKMIYPRKTVIEKPHALMPDEVREIYDEAAAVYDLSPRSSTALLRLALELLLPHLGVEGKGIDDMIGKLVGKGTISEEIQMAMDSLRVIGNNAVHPGNIEMENEDDSSVSMSLFELLNYIVTQTIANKKRTEKIYSILPKSALKSIERRDAKNKKA